MIVNAKSEENNASKLMGISLPTSRSSLGLWIFATAVIFMAL